jgi:hypothetical protein
MPRNVKKVRTEKLIFILVIVAAVLGIYYMWGVNVGKAYTQAPQIIVNPVETEFCCCATEQGNLYEVLGHVTKDASPEERTSKCKSICEVEHSTPAHQSTLKWAGKCAF